MKTPDGFRVCRTKRCKALIATRYAFIICTACAIKQFAHWRLQQELEAEKHRRVVALAASKRMKKLRKEMKNERGRHA